MFNLFDLTMNLIRQRRKREDRFVIQNACGFSSVFLLGSKLMHVTNLAIFFIGYQTYELLMSFRRAVHYYNNEIQTPEVAPQFVPLHNEGAGETLSHWKLYNYFARASRDMPQTHKILPSGT